MPRSGSTLLQKILMGHASVSSFSEPWIALPIVYLRKSSGLISEFGHKNTVRAVDFLADGFPNGEDDLKRIQRGFLQEVYGTLSQNNETYFLDKTPRYYNIIPELADLFPDGRFIFLFRNPVQVFASVLLSWRGNSYKRLHKNWADIYEAPGKLAEQCESLGNRAFKLQYEDMVTDPEKSIKQLLVYLDLSFEESMIAEYKKQDLKGRMGDNLGINQYNTITNKSLEKWKTTVINGFRRKIYYRYIQNLPEQFFTVSGYSRNALLEEVRDCPAGMKSFLSDRFDYLKSKLYYKYNLHIVLRKKQYNRHYM